MRIAAKIDANQPEIVKALRQVGCTVQSLAATGKGCPDLLIGLKCKNGDRLNLLFEIKDGLKPKSARKLTPDQVIWHNEWNGKVYVVESVDQALEIINSIR